MKKEVLYNINTKFINNNPSFIISIDYRDVFSDDNYLLKSEETNNGENIPVIIVKNGKRIGKEFLLKRDIFKLLNKFFDIVNDYDFKEEFFKNNIDKSINDEMNMFFEEYEKDYVEPELNLEGEIKRMKKIAGIILN